MTHLCNFWSHLLDRLPSELKYIFDIDDISSFTLRQIINLLKKFDGPSNITIEYFSEEYFIFQRLEEVEESIYELPMDIAFYRENKPIEFNSNINIQYLANENCYCHPFEIPDENNKVGAFRSVRFQIERFIDYEALHYVQYEVEILTKIPIKSKFYYNCHEIPYSLVLQFRFNVDPMEEWLIYHTNLGLKFNRLLSSILYCYCYYYKDWLLKYLIEFINAWFETEVLKPVDNGN